MASSSTVPLSLAPRGRLSVARICRRRAGCGLFGLGFPSGPRRRVYCRNTLTRSSQGSAAVATLAAGIVRNGKDAVSAAYSHAMADSEGIGGFRGIEGWCLPYAIASPGNVDEFRMPSPNQPNGAASPQRSGVSWKTQLGKRDVTRRCLLQVIGMRVNIKRILPVNARRRYSVICTVVPVVNAALAGKHGLL